jgi:two-component system nitrate/nitrite response regulator NarL
VIADDHPMFRECVERAVEHHADVEVVASAADGREALAAIRALRPQVAVLDLRMPDLDGAAVLNAVVRDGLPTRVMVLSGLLDDETVYSVLESGAAAVLNKTALSSEVLDAILAVARGETVVGSTLQGGVAAQIRLRARGERPRLTAREREILVLMSYGVSGPEIARRLNLSLSTVKTHTQKLFDALGVNERAAAVAEGMRRGLIE